jgi:hypothetical protein
MFAVEIRVSDDRRLTECVSEASAWLSRKRILPETFRYIFEPPGVLFRVDFTRPSEAVAFAAEFSGVATYVGKPAAVVPPKTPLAPRSALGVAAILTQIGIPQPRLGFWCVSRNAEDLSATPNGSDRRGRAPAVSE